MDCVKEAVESSNKKLSNNYILRLQREIEELKQNKKEALEALNDLLRYLASDKFSFDTTVQVSDVFGRLWDIRKNLY